MVGGDVAAKGVIFELVSPESQPVSVFTRYGDFTFTPAEIPYGSSRPVTMRAGGWRASDYFRGSARLHSLGLLGGVIWMLALGFNVIASGVAGPAISYALGQGATLIAAIWGVAIWKEFRGAPAGVTPLLVMMFAAYSVGLVLIGSASL